MRPISQDVYGIRERVIGRSTTFAYTSNDHGGTITHKPEADYLDDGPEEAGTDHGTASAAVRCSRPAHSNGDIPMLQFTHHTDKPIAPARPARRRRARGFNYTTGAEQALKQAEADGWTVVSIKNDWTAVFPPLSRRHQQ